VGREAQGSTSPLTPQPLTELPLLHVFELAMSTFCFCKKHRRTKLAEFVEIRKCDVSLRFLYMSRYLTQVSLSSFLTCFTRRTFVAVGVKKQGKVSCGSFVDSCEISSNCTIWFSGIDTRRSVLRTRPEQTEANEPVVSTLYNCYSSSAKPSPVVPVHSKPL